MLGERPEVRESSGRRPSELVFGEGRREEFDLIISTNSYVIDLDGNEWYLDSMYRPNTEFVTHSRPLQSPSYPGQIEFWSDRCSNSTLVHKTAHNSAKVLHSATWPTLLALKWQEQE